MPVHVRVLLTILPSSQLWMKILCVNIPLASSTFTNLADLILPTKVSVSVCASVFTHTTTRSNVFGGGAYVRSSNNNNV